jgi:hypothetical protein
LFASAAAAVQTFPPSVGVAAAVPWRSKTTYLLLPEFLTRLLWGVEALAIRVLVVEALRLQLLLEPALRVAAQGV